MDWLVIKILFEGVFGTYILEKAAQFHKSKIISDVYKNENTTNIITYVFSVLYKKAFHVLKAIYFTMRFITCHYLLIKIQ
jgi:hypothetical protein